MTGSRPVDRYILNGDWSAVIDVKIFPFCLVEEIKPISLEDQKPHASSMEISTAVFKV